MEDRLHFRPELPNPVPGEDQSQWGYPFTLQIFGRDQRFTMTLYQGSSPSGDPVPCHFTNPQEPLNVELAPDDAYCPIPRSALKASTTYTVVAESDLGEEIIWSFRTGS